MWRTYVQHQIRQVPENTKLKLTDFFAFVTHNCMLFYAIMIRHDQITCCCLLCSKAINAAPAPPDVDIAAEARKMKRRQRLRVLRASSRGYWISENTRELIKSGAKNIQGEWLMLSDFCSCPWWVLGSTFRSAWGDWKCRPRCYGGTGQGPKALALQVLENLEECVAFLHALNQ